MKSPRDRSWTTTPTRPPPARRIGPRQTIEGLVLLAVALLLGRTWCIEGLLVPLRVTSGSMAETLLGPHWKITCADCGFTFPCGADRPPPGLKVVCPNCAYEGNRLDENPLLAGDRLLLDKVSFCLRLPRRWEVAAFRDPQRASRVVVKRVVGLPGESVEIRNGDVYVNGQIVRKTLSQQRTMAVLVHDADFPPHDSAMARWQPERPDTHWVSLGGTFTHPGTPEEATADWLNYVHWRRGPGDNRPHESPITNQCHYNQVGPQRGENLDPATDLMLSFRIARLKGPGQFRLRISDGSERFEVWIRSDGRAWRVFRNQEVVDPAAAGPLPGNLEGVRVEASLFDQQLLVAFDGRPALVFPYQRAPGPAGRGVGRLGLAAVRLEIVLRELRVYRDVYYTRPLGGAERQGPVLAARLGDDEYLVLGDNGPLSEDSRSWSAGPALPGRLLVGRPLAVHFPAKSLQWGRWRFQVPDPARMRYIR